MKCPADRCRRPGFTLMEVLVALTVFLVGICSVLALFTAGTTLHQGSQMTSAATDLVDAALLTVERELAEVPEAELSTGKVMRSARPFPGADGFSYSYLVTERPHGGYFLELTIHWKEGGREQTHKTRSALPASSSLARLVQKRLRS